MFAYERLRQTVANLMVPDDDLLRRVGLGALLKAYRAYPTVLDGFRVCILLPHGLRPKEAGQLTEVDALKQNIMVLREDAKRWSRVWPEKTGGDGGTEDAAPAQRVA